MQSQNTWDSGRQEVTMRNLLFLLMLISQAACGPLLFVETQSLPTLYVPDYPLFQIDNTFRQELELSFRLLDKPDQADYLLLISPSSKGLQVTLVDLISRASSIYNYSVLGGRRKIICKMIARDVSHIVQSPLSAPLPHNKEDSI